MSTTIWLYGIGLLFAVIGATWSLSSRITAVEVTLKMLMENHLKHLQDDLDLMKRHLGIG